MEVALLLDPTRKAVLTQPARLASLAQIGGDRVTAMLSVGRGHDTMAYHVALCATPSDLATWAKPFSIPAWVSAVVALARHRPALLGALRLLG